LFLFICLFVRLRVRTLIERCRTKRLIELLSSTKRIHLIHTCRCAEIIVIACRLLFIRSACRLCVRIVIVPRVLIRYIWIRVIRVSVALYVIITLASATTATSIAAPLSIHTVIHTSWIL
jgi:hypothetical protein